jgi:hypothetical protein
VSVLDREAPLALELLTFVLRDSGVRDRRSSRRPDLDPQTPEVGRHALEETCRLEHALGQAETCEVRQERREFALNLDGVKCDVQSMASQRHITRTQKAWIWDVWIYLLEPSVRGRSLRSAEGPPYPSSACAPARRSIIVAETPTTSVRSGRSESAGTEQLGEPSGFVCAPRRGTEPMKEESVDVLRREQSWHAECRSRRTLW